jgi:hypothetical protein
MVTRAPRLLVKAKPMPQGTAFNVGKVPFTLHPLFPGSPRTAAMGAAPASEWHFTDIPNDADEFAVWDLLVGFFGAASGATDDALNYAKKRARGGKPRYCQPGGAPIVLEELPDVRFRVLGPPKDEKLIKKSNPGKNEGYELDAGPGGSQAFWSPGWCATWGPPTVRYWTIRSRTLLTRCTQFPWRAPSTYRSLKSATTAIRPMVVAFMERETGFEPFRQQQIRGDYLVLPRFGEYTSVPVGHNMSFRLSGE